jgi:hypothetical protein
LTGIYAYKIVKYEKQYVWTKNLYYNIQKCVNICLYGYRIGSWKCYRLETSIIRTSRTWECAKWIKFSRRLTSGQITEKIGFSKFV